MGKLETDQHTKARLFSFDFWLFTQQLNNNNNLRQNDFHHFFHLQDLLHSKLLNKNMLHLKNVTFNSYMLRGLKSGEQDISYVFGLLRNLIFGKLILVY